MKISILLPYKENFSPSYAGAVSIYVKSTTLCSRYKKKITIFGSTDFKKKLLINYVNLPFNKEIFQSGSKIYLGNFLKVEAKNKSDIIEIHNRPAVFNYLAYRIEQNRKLILYFHNDPLSLRGSITKEQRINILEKASAIIFVSEWTKKRFFTDLNFSLNHEKINVVYPSVNKNRFYNKKEKIILFFGNWNLPIGHDQNQ